MTMSRWRHSTMHGLRISVADAVFDLDADGYVENVQDVTPAAAQKMRAAREWVEVAVKVAPPSPAVALPVAPTNIPEPIVEPAPVDPEPEPTAPVQSEPVPNPLAAPAYRPGKGKRK